MSRADDQWRWDLDPPKLTMDLLPEPEHGCGCTCISHTCPACLAADRRERGDDDPEDDAGYCLDALVSQMAAYDAFLAHHIERCHITRREELDADAP